MKQWIKRRFLGAGARPMRILSGPGAGMWMRLDPSCQTQRYLGLDERELAAWLKRWVPKVRSCIDVGANDGYYTLAFLASGVERVIACEPGPVVESLIGNARLNGWDLGDHLTVVRSLIGRGEGCVRLAKLLEGLPRPILVKVDVDGAEVDVLESASGAESLEDVYWIVETHSGDLERACIDWFVARGQHARVVKNAWWRCLIPELRVATQNRWLLSVGRNLVVGGFRRRT